MSHNSWLPSLKDRPLFSGKPEQAKEWSDLFMVRARHVPRTGDVEFYISTKSSAQQIEDTNPFRSHLDAKFFIEQNWRAMYDKIFEKEILGGE